MDDTSSVDSDLVKDLISMIDQHNVQAKSFRKVRDEVERHGPANVSMRLFRSRNNDPKILCGNLHDLQKHYVKLSEL